MRRLVLRKHRTIGATLILLTIALLLAGCGKNLGGRETTGAPEGLSVSGEETAPALTFTTTDREENEWTESCFSEFKLTILNFWEPWCGPCVAEMPDLQKISQDYADRGVQVIGIYETPDAEADVDQILTEGGVAYPILHYSRDFDFLQTGFVPTTVIVDCQGKILVQPFAGSMDYDGWVEIVEANLE